MMTETSLRPRGLRLLLPTPFFHLRTEHLDVHRLFTALNLREADAD